MAKLFASPGTFNPLLIPSRNTDFVFTYIVCAFGWAAGIFLAIMFAAYIIRIIHTAALVKDSYGRLLVSGFAAIFAVRFFWNIPMALGITPITGVSLPFISYGRIDYLVNMAAIGLILSVYRRKNISIFEANN
jgi:cell division protein FtsW (lipid II flippase)